MAQHNGPNAGKRYHAMFFQVGCPLTGSNKMFGERAVRMKLHKIGENGCAAPRTGTYSISWVTAQVSFAQKSGVTIRNLVYHGACS